MTGENSDPGDPPRGRGEYLTDGEIEKSGRVLLGDMPLARTWDYRVTRAGFSGL